MTARALALTLAAAAALGAQTEETMLANGWRVAPAGRQVQLDTFPLSSAASPDGQYLLVLHAGERAPSIWVLEAQTGKEVSRIPVPDAWLGLTFAPKGNLVYVGGGAQAAVYEFSFTGGRLTPARTFPLAEAAKRSDRDFAGDVAFSPDGRMLYVAELYQNSIAVINPQSGRVIDRFKTGRRPYRILFHPDGRSYFVSCWADGMVLRHETATGKMAGKYLLAPHPTDMIWVPGRPKPALEGEPSPYTARIFVALSNTNSLRVLGVRETGEIQVSETVNLGMSPLQPAGMTPGGLALDASKTRVLVACADENAVAVVDASEVRSRVVGYIPAGRYPTAVRALAGGRLAVVNGGSGTLSLIEDAGDEGLETYSAAVLANSPYRDAKLEDAGTPEGSPVPAWPGDPTPIRHVVYVVVNHGWTYDAVFGDMPGGDGDASRVRYPEAVTPNLRQLAREFVLLDNFRAIGETAADGYNWSVAAISPDYVEKLRRASAAGRRERRDFEEPEPAAVPPAGYLWNNARAAGVTVASYAANRSSQAQVDAVLKDAAGFEQKGEMPKLTFVRLADAEAAGNDRAVGALVAGLSRTRFWPSMAIFVVPAHTGGGADHMDRQRAAALVVSPFVKRRTVDKNRYNTASVLRTIELIAGLQPMTQFDAAATPVSACFQAGADAAPYTAAGR